jgi:flagellar hook-associated protein 1 FlgK
MATWTGISTALSSLQAQRVAMDIAGQNIANVNTPGYVRQRVQLSSGLGVDVSAIQRLQSGVLGDRARTEGARLGELTVTSTVLNEIEQVFPEPSSTGLATKLDALWSGFADVARDPSNAAARIQVVEQANVVTFWLNDAAQRLTDMSTDYKQSLANLVTSANSYAEEIADLNIAISQSVQGTSDTNSLLDQRSYAATQLSNAIGGTFTIDDANIMRVALGGTTLVGSSSYAALQVNTTAGTTTVQWASNDSTAAITSGTASGYLDTINTVIPEWTASLNTVAAALTSKVNTAQAAGYDLDGIAGAAMFTGTTAATIAVAFSDGAGIAASTIAPTGGVASLNGSNADTMSALGTVSGGPDGLYQSLVVSLGYSTQAANQSAQTQESFNSSIRSQIDSESGVNIDEEMANLLTYQRAYEAAARVLTAIDEALATLINRTGLVGR